MTISQCAEAIHTVNYSFGLTTFNKAEYERNYAQVIEHVAAQKNDAIQVAKAYVETYQDARNVECKSSVHWRESSIKAERTAREPVVGLSAEPSARCPW
jgi:hypothetical protein